uniref:Uncharacterized protein n=1 Tax=Arundo donax TaxID=35708 RepID=A0A0A8ZI53_ARUDO
MLHLVEFCKLIQRLKYFISFGVLAQSMLVLPLQCCFSCP